jgi:hypothetical protein
MAIVSVQRSSTLQTGIENGWRFTAQPGASVTGTRNVSPPRLVMPAGSRPSREEEVERRARKIAAATSVPNRRDDLGSKYCNQLGYCLGGARCLSARLHDDALFPPQAQVRTIGANVATG